MKLMLDGGPTSTTKIWEIEVAKKTVTTNTGPKGSPKKQVFGTPALAQAAHDKLVAAKRDAGYRQKFEVDPAKLTTPRNEALEAAIREDRGDPAPYLVYADWLQGQGSKLGELIALAHANKRARATTIAKQFGLPRPDLATVGWRHGFWQWLRLENTIDWMDDSFDAVAIARPLFASPLCGVLEELRIGVLRWDHNEVDVPLVLAEAGRHPWANSLARLHLGDIGADIDLAHHVIGDVGKAITKWFPNLTSLKLRSSEQSWRGGKDTFGIGGLALPKLKELTIETCDLSRKRIKHLHQAKLPALERLELWFGGRESNVKAADVVPLLDDKLFPRVRHLGLRNCKLVADVVRLLPTTRLAGKLETLDLSMGTLNDAEAAELAEAASRFTALRTLDVDDSYLTRAGLRTLQTAFRGKTIVSKAQRERDIDDDDDDDDGRYVSVEE